MPTLRARAIRLAYSQPALRPHLLPLLLRTARDKTALRIKQLEKMLNSSERQFAVLTPEVAEEGSGAKAGGKTQFVIEMMRMGYPKSYPIKASWEGVPEHSFLVPGMTFQDALFLGLKYKQDAVIFKDPSGALGSYYPTGKTVVVAVKPDGEIDAAISARPDLYSKARGISFSFGLIMIQKIPWDMTRPVTKKDVLGFIRDGLIQF